MAQCSYALEMIIYWPADRLQILLPSGCWFCSFSVGSGAPLPCLIRYIFGVYYTFSTIILQRSERMRPSQTYNDDPLGSWWWGAAQKLCAEMNKRQSGGDEKRNNNCWGMAGVLLWEEEGGPVRRSHHNNKSHIIPNITMFGAHNKRGTAAATVLLRGSVMEVILADWMRCQRDTGRDSGVEQIWPAAAAPTMMKHNTFRKILGKELLARVEIVREKSEWWGEHQQYIKQCC